MAEEKFTVDSEAKADWTLRKIKDIRGEIDKHKAKYKEHKKALDDWDKAKMGELEGSEEHFSELLKAYYHEQKGKDPKYELDTPAGRLSSSMRTSWNYDNEVLVDYLESHDYEDLVKVTKSPRKADIKKTFTVPGDGFVYDENGEKVEGIELTEEPGYTLTLREPKWEEGEF